MDTIDIINYSKVISCITSSIVCVLALIIFFCKRKDFFRSNFAKIQIDELVKYKHKAHETWYKLYYVMHTASVMRSTNQSLDEIKKLTPDSWNRFQEVNSNLLELYYLFSNKENYIFINTLEKDIVSDIAKTLSKFKGFTLYSLSKLSEDEKQELMNCLSEIEKEFNNVVVKLAT